MIPGGAAEAMNPSQPSDAPPLDAEPPAGGDALRGEEAHELNHTTDRDPDTSASRGTTRVLPATGGRSRLAHPGLAIRFERCAGDDSLGRLVDSTIWVNESHAAYRRATASRSEGYPLAPCVALALAPLAVEPAQAQGFVTAFLTRWGLRSNVPLAEELRAANRAHCGGECHPRELT